MPRISNQERCIVDVVKAVTVDLDVRVHRWLDAKANAGTEKNVVAADVNHCLRAPVGLTREYFNRRMVSSVAQLHPVDEYLKLRTVLHFTIISSLPSAAYFGTPVCKRFRSERLPTGCPISTSSGKTRCCSAGP